MNPLKEVRLRSGMTQRFIAKETNMSPHAILRYEQGLYNELSPKLSLFCSKYLEVLPSTVDRAYHEAQKERRLESAQWLDPFPPLIMSPHDHPFVLFRNVVTSRAVGKKSRIGFCILLAMNPAVVIQYERGLAKHMPALMSGCLRDAGVSETHITELDNYGEIWMERYGGSD